MTLAENVSTPFLEEGYILQEVLTICDIFGRNVPSIFHITFVSLLLATSFISDETFRR